ncbi:MAG: amidohydrolase family protein [Streptosporangiaceae bacterium]
MWFVNANVVDALTGERLFRRSVETAADGTVVQVAATAPPGQDAVDVAGRWLLPGLISCHTHLSIVFPFSATDEAENPALTAYRAATRASEALRAGITTIRCVHEQNRADLLLRTAVRCGWFAAPRILGAGRAVSTPSGHGQGSGCAYATGEQEFYLAALAELAAGADHVKIFINSGLAGPDENYEHAEMTDGEIRGAVRAAAEHDTYVVAHSGEPTAIRQALAQGVRCFEHAYRLDDETAARLARPGIFVTPTLCVTRSESWMRDRGFEEHSIRHASQAADVHLASVQRAIRAGVTLVNGTDIPPGDPVGGIPAAVHELLLMAAAGLSPLLSLQSMSVNAAALLGIGDHVGQIRPGYAADFVAVAADPLDDLAALRTISLVVQGGRVIREDAS